MQIGRAFHKINYDRPSQKIFLKNAAEEPRNLWNGRNELFRIVEKIVAGNIANFPQIAEWIRERCSNYQEPFIRESVNMIEYCFDLDTHIPERYGWRFSDVECIRRQINSASSPKEINRIFWTDQARNVEAYSMMSFWRGVELVKSATRCLNVKEIISPAVLARSAIELACCYLTNANLLDKTLRELQFPPDTIVLSKEFEKLILKMIWGTRLGDPEPYLKQTNILTIIQRLSKNPNAKDILPLYEYLCEIAHPNVIGNIRFWSHIDYDYQDGSQRWVISRFAETEIRDDILGKVMWGLGWSSAAFRNAFEITATVIQKLLTKINGQHET